MLLRLIAMSLVMMGCASEVLGAKFKCKTTASDITDCIWKPENDNIWMEFSGQIDIFNMSAVTSILKKLKTDGCIKKSTLKDIQKWIKLHTPPKPVCAIYKSLTEDQKTTLKSIKTIGQDSDKMEKYVAAYGVVLQKINELSEANAKKYNDWAVKRSEICQDSHLW